MNLRRYLAAFGLSGLGKGFMLPILSLMILSRGLNASTLALATGTFALAVVLLELPSGMASDRWGHRRVYFIAQLLGASGDLVLAFSNAVFMGMALMGAATAFESGSLSSLFFQRWIDEQGKQTLPQATVRMNVLETGGLALGALVGGMVGSASPAPLLPYAPLLLARFILRLGAVAAAVGIPDDRPLPHSATQVGNWRQLLGNRTLLILLAGNTILGAALGNLEIYWPPHLQQLAGGYTPLTGVMSCISMFGATVGMALIGRLAAHLPLQWVYILCQFAVAGLLALLGMTDSIWGYMSCFGILYLCLGGSDLARTSMIQAAVPAPLRATFMSLDSLLVRLGAMLGSCMAAVVLVHWGVPQLWAWMGLMLAAGVVLQTALGITKKPAF